MEAALAGLDVLVITALRSEYEATRTVGLSGYADNPGVVSWKHQGRETPTPFVLGDYVLASGDHLTIALARPTRMGSTATSPVVSSLVGQLRPTCLAMCGVCAGNAKEVALGDVIVAELAYPYDEGLRSPDGFLGDHRQIPLPDAWVRTAQDMSVEDLPSFGAVSDEDARVWTLQRLYEGDDPRRHLARSRYVSRNRWAEHITALQSEGLIRRTGRDLSLTDAGFSYIENVLFSNVAGPDKLPFSVTVGPMASGNVVVRDGITWEHLAQLGVRSVAGLDMEAATIAHTAHRLRVPEWVVVKGVMDHADPRKDDRYKAFAERAAAEVLFKLLALRLRSHTHVQTTHASRVRSVYVIGGVTEETEYPDFEEAELADFCRRLGETVANSGADLIVCSPFPESADFHALMGYVQSGAGHAVHLHRPRHGRVDAKEAELRAMLGPEAAQHVRTWLYPGPELEDADSWGQAWMLCQIMALDRADVVISVGGRVSRTANTLLHLAEARQKPIVPFEFLGGASRRAFNRRDWGRAYPGLDFLKLRDKAAAADAMRMADHMMAVRMSSSRGYTWPPKHVFISRARADAEFAHALDGYLSGAGLNVLLGERGLQADQTVESAIENAVLRADLFIALWSKSYALSQFCYDEIEFALQRHRAGELQVWLVNLDGSDIIPPSARSLPQAVARTPYSLVAVVRELLELPRTGPPTEGSLSAAQTYDDDPGRPGGDLTSGRPG